MIKRKTFKNMFNLLFILSFFIFNMAFGQSQNPPFRVILDWYINPNHAPLFVAQEYGFFKKYHLNVKLIPPADPSDAPKMVALKQADLGITYAPSFKVQQAAGLPLVQIGVLIHTPLYSIIVLKDSGIHSLKDLKGKTVGYSVSGGSHEILQKMLKNNELTLKDIRLINVHFNLVQALLSKKVDAIAGAARNVEPLEIKMAGETPRLFLPENEGVPNFAEMIFIARKDKTDDPRIAAFLAALHEAETYLAKHPEETWQTFVKNYPALNNEINHQSWITSIPYFH